MSQNIFIKIQGLFLSAYCFSSIAYAQINQTPDYPNVKMIEEGIIVKQTITDSLFDSKQIITQLSFSEKYYDQFRIVFNHQNLNMLKTSEHGKSKAAIAAVNGGFFNMKKGWSVTYFEQNDTVISLTRVAESKRLDPAYLFNAAIVITKEGSVVIEPVRPDAFYASSKRENAVLVSGPLLLSHSKAVTLPNIDFVNKRHPRTCICTTEKAVVLTTVDGRSTHAEGMSLHEVQRILIDMGCIDAVNLDGGGSTTMWTKTHGIMNSPSDASGERSVSNAILIVKRNPK